MTEYVVTFRHYLTKPGTVLTYVEPSPPETNIFGEPYMVARHPQGYLMTIPHSKVVKRGDPTYSPYDTINS